MHPRTRLKKLYHKTSKDKKIDTTGFANKIIVEERHVQKYVSHLNSLERNKKSVLHIENKKRLVKHVKSMHGMRTMTGYHFIKVAN